MHNVFRTLNVSPRQSSLVMVAMDGKVSITFHSTWITDEAAEEASVLRQLERPAPALTGPTGPPARAHAAVGQHSERATILIQGGKSGKNWAEAVKGGCWNTPRLNFQLPAKRPPWETQRDLPAGRRALGKPRPEATAEAAAAQGSSPTCLPAQPLGAAGR